MDYRKLNIIFFGTPKISVSAFSALIENSYTISAVVTNPDKPAGREQNTFFSPVKSAALKNKIEVLQPEKLKDPETIKKIKNLKPDLFVVFAYGKIIPKEILDLTEYGAINIHPSLLPKYRGPSPIQYPILNGDSETGITIMLLDEKMDHGVILNQKIVKIEQNETDFSLAEKLKSVGAALLVETIPLWIDKKIIPSVQNEEEATYTELLTREHGKINWDEDVKTIERKIRAFYSWPGTYTNYKIKTGIKRLKILKAKIGSLDSKPNSRHIGQIFLSENKELAVQTAKGYLILEELQSEGKKVSNSLDFISGQRDILGKILG